MITIKRIFEKPQEDDGFRILIDRLWPRGLSKEKAKIDLLLKEIAPSDELRKWFSHDPEKWNDFKKKYNLELKDNLELAKKIKQIEKEEKTITLLYSAKDTAHNNAIVLREFIKGQ
ncbi:MAG: DUF488 domain-containing protein [Flavobacteriaceae bacterium]|nr:DUF488 domain-containing protein [Flavobacteriaceae bacterium]